MYAYYLNLAKNVGTVNNCYPVFRQGTRKTYEQNTRTGFTVSKTVGRLFEVPISKYEGKKQHANVGTNSFVNTNI